MFKGIVAIGAYLHTSPGGVVLIEIDRQPVREDFRRTGVQTSSECVVGVLISVVGAFQHAHARLKISQVSRCGGAHG